MLAVLWNRFGSCDCAVNPECRSVFFRLRAPPSEGCFAGLECCSRCSLRWGFIFQSSSAGMHASLTLPSQAMAGPSHFAVSEGDSFCVQFELDDPASTLACHWYHNNVRLGLCETHVACVSQLSLSESFASASFDGVSTDMAATGWAAAATELSRSLLCRLATRLVETVAIASGAVPPMVPCRRRKLRRGICDREEGDHARLRALAARVPSVLQGAAVIALELLIGATLAGRGGVCCAESVASARFSVAAFLCSNASGSGACIPSSSTDCNPVAFAEDVVQVASLCLTSSAVCVCSPGCTSLGAANECNDAQGYFEHRARLATRIPFVCVRDSESRAVAAAAVSAFCGLLGGAPVRDDVSVAFVVRAIFYWLPAPSRAEIAPSAEARSVGSDGQAVSPEPPTQASMNGGRSVETPPVGGQQTRSQEQEPSSSAPLPVRAVRKPPPRPSPPPPTPPSPSSLPGSDRSSNEVVGGDLESLIVLSAAPNARGSENIARTFSDHSARRLQTKRSPFRPLLASCRAQHPLARYFRVDGGIAPGAGYVLPPVKTELPSYPTRPTPSHPPREGLSVGACARLQPSVVVEDEFGPRPAKWLVAAAMGAQRKARHGSPEGDRSDYAKLHTAAREAENAPAIRSRSQPPTPSVECVGSFAINSATAQQRPQMQVALSGEVLSLPQTFTSSAVVAYATSAAHGLSAARLSAQRIRPTKSRINALTAAGSTSRAYRLPSAVLPTAPFSALRDTCNVVADSVRDRTVTSLLSRNVHAGPRL